MKTIDLFPLTEEAISFKKFVSLSEEEKDSIDTVKVVPPKLGKPGFGKIIVRYKSPIYKHNICQTEGNGTIIR